MHAESSRGKGRGEAARKMVDLRKWNVLLLP
eukprot:CAMPEP_0174378336 /NCGR_PEP_ID=MMETSP0811_2-20130205/121987_1 /TAXON_ID=73025 ORGANISM="Eutreptiella gymnastica-like, Strain CCMP1594" /NCGR_SAMPLE_ID=MMETSP0811_2 /ASSEMBLY_ACC=CAM_ASM_000667 /LENGTH=30 /DNA_ID= /DNA_START= /DNA_END= /DNA_ORIENTATION=